MIFDRLKTAPVGILDQVFHTAYEWQYNRPNPERWIEFVASLPEQTFSVYRKKRIIATLTAENHHPFGIMLDRPPQGRTGRVRPHSK